MKRISLILLSIVLFLSFTITPVLSSTPPIETIKKYATAYIPKNGIFVVHNKYMGWVKVMTTKETKIHIIKTTIVKNPENPLETIELVEFSLSFDKPGIKCEIHGTDTYEMYSKSLGYDGAFIPKKTLIKYSPIK